MLLRDLMTRTLHGIDPKTTLQDAAQTMRALDVGALPVCENDRLLGILTDRDIAVRAVAEGRSPKRTRARDIMTPDVIFCFDDDDVREAARIMEERQIRRLLICDRSKHPVGIISLGDIATRVQSDDLSGEILERVSEPSQMHS
jgi:CBS domain-containing protein